MKLRFLLIAAAIAAASGGLEAQAQTPAPAPAAAPAQPLNYGLAIDYAHARIAADAAIAASKAMNLGSDIAIVGPAGELILFEKMDGTLLASVNISQAKAHTAVAFKRPSKAFRDLVDAGTNYVLAMPDTIPSEGGVPIIVDGKIIGAIGVSGGNGAQDGAVAKAGADAVAVAAK